jgi:hypothetical protein
LRFFVVKSKTHGSGNGAGFPVAKSIGSASPHEVRLFEKTLGSHLVDEKLERLIEIDHMIVLLRIASLSSTRLALSFLSEIFFKTHSVYWTFCPYQIESIYSRSQFFRLEE